MPDVDPDHSVTCAFCGELADERRTIPLWEDDYEGSDNLKPLMRIAPDGESHIECFEDWKAVPDHLPNDLLDRADYLAELSRVDTLSEEELLQVRQDVARLQFAVESVVGAVQPALGSMAEAVNDAMEPLVEIANDMEETDDR